MSRKNALRKAAAETPHTAAERGAAALDLTIERIQPLLDQASDAVTPLWENAQERLAPLANDARARALDAKVHAAKYAANTMDNLQPRLNDALDRVVPAVDRAQRTVQDEVIPKVIDMLRDASEPVSHALENVQETAQDIQKRGARAYRAAQAEFVAAPAPKPRRGRRAFKVLGIAALVGAGVVAVRAVLQARDTGWAAHEPSPAYTYTDARPASKTAGSSSATDAKAKATEANAKADSAKASSASSAAAAPKAAAATDSKAASSAKASKDSADAGSDKAAESKDYGPNSYVGETPPEGYIIKGNERSMKYHMPGTGGYERTIAEVWFNSEDAAQAAGFTKAQR